MNSHLLMVLAALVVALAISAWLLGTRNWATVQVMQLGLAGQVVLMVLSLLNWHLDKAEPQCQEQMRSQQAMQQAVFFGEEFSLGANFPHVAGGKFQASAGVPIVLDREEFAQPQHAHLRLGSCYIFREAELRRYNQRSIPSSKQLYPVMAFMRPNEK